MRKTGGFTKGFGPAMAAQYNARQEQEFKEQMQREEARKDKDLELREREIAAMEKLVNTIAPQVAEVHSAVKRLDGQNQLLFQLCTMMAHRIDPSIDPKKNNPAWYAQGGQGI